MLLLVADKLDGAIVYFEGMATGVSIHEGTKLATVCAMNAALARRGKGDAREMPEREIILAADSDTDCRQSRTDEGDRAAKAVGAKLAVPMFQDTSTKTV